MVTKRPRVTVAFPALVQMWQNADPDLVDVCMAPDVQVWQPLTEVDFVGADKYREQLEDHYAKARLHDVTCTLVHTLTSWFPDCLRFSLQ